VYFPGKPFQPGLIFVGKARSLPYIGASERLFNRIGSCFTNKHWTRLERLNRSKYSSLLLKFVTYGRKKFYNIGPGSNVIKMSVIYGFSRSAEAFDPGKLFQPSLMLEGMAQKWST
jgi:hypothetical protein